MGGTRAEVLHIRRLLFRAVLPLSCMQSKESVEILVLLEFCPGGNLLTRVNQLMEAGRVLPFAKVCGHDNLTNGRYT